jgi:outer membrane protein TolC
MKMMKMGHHMLNNMKPFLKAAGLCFRLLLFLLFFLPFHAALGQTQLKQYIDSARINNSQIINLQNQIKILELGKRSIKARYQAPKGYLSSDINLVPYFNNNGNIFTTNPLPNAIGYDIGITNGGLYSALMNMDIPLFSRTPVQRSLFWQNQKIKGLKITLRNLNYNLERQITHLYFNTLGIQLSYLTQRESVQLLSKEVKILAQLTRKGLYRLVDYELLKTTLSNDSIKLQSLANAYRLQLLQLKSACGISDRSFRLLKMETIQISHPPHSTSSFIQPYVNDSLTAIAQNRVFNNRYLPKVMFYSNAGLNGVSLHGLERKFGLSAGIRLTYTLFDGKQKEVNKEQSLVKIERAQSLKNIKSKNIGIQRATLLKSIAAARATLQKQEKLKHSYENLIHLYKVEVQKGQVPVTGFLMALRNYNNLKLSYGLQKIKLYQLINEYNYWNH